MIKVFKEDETLSKKKTLQKTREHQQAIIQQMKETKCWGCDFLSYHITQTDTHVYYKKEMDSI